MNRKELAIFVGLMAFGGIVVLAGLGVFGIAAASGAFSGVAVAVLVFWSGVVFFFWSAAITAAGFLRGFRDEQSQAKA